MKATIKYRFPVKHILALYLAGCSFKNAAIPISNNSKPLNGTFLTYHSAMSSGKGIIFRVAIPLVIENNFTIDSFFLNEKNYPFNLIKSENKTLLEANYYVAVPQLSYSKNQIQKRDTTIKITDSIIVHHLFYPSWITVTGKRGKQRIEILSYKEIISDSKY